MQAELRWIRLQGLSRDERGRLYSQSPATDCMTAGTFIRRRLTTDINTEISGSSGSITFTEHLPAVFKSFAYVQHWRCRTEVPEQVRDFEWRKKWGVIFVYFRQKVYRQKCDDAERSKFQQSSVVTIFLKLSQIVSFLCFWACSLNPESSQLLIIMKMFSTFK